MDILLCKEPIQKVFRLQKRAARVRLGADTKANGVKLFKQLGCVPFYHDAKMIKSILLYKRGISKGYRAYLTQMLVRNSDVNGRTSRHCQLNLVCLGDLRVEGLFQYRLPASGIWCLPILKTSLLLQSSKQK